MSSSPRADREPADPFPVAAAPPSRRRGCWPRRCSRGVPAGSACAPSSWLQRCRCISVVSLVIGLVTRRRAASASSPTGSTTSCGPRANRSRRLRGAAGQTRAHRRRRRRPGPGVPPRPGQATRTVGAVDRATASGRRAASSPPTGRGPTLTPAGSRTTRRASPPSGHPTTRWTSTASALPAWWRTRMPDGGADRHRPAARPTSTTTVLRSWRIVMLVALVGARADRATSSATLHRAAPACGRCGGLPPPPRRSPTCRSTAVRCALPTRVAEVDADPHTEVGQLGSALNRMLDHIAAALSRAARQRDAGAPVRRRRQPRTAHPARRDPRLHRTGATQHGGRARRRRARDEPGGVRDRADDRARRGHVAAGAPRLRAAARARAGRPVPAGRRRGQRRPHRRSRPPVVARPARRAGHRRRATRRGCIRCWPTCSPTPARTPRPAPR